MLTALRFQSIAILQDVDLTFAALPVPTLPPQPTADARWAIKPMPVEFLESGNQSDVVSLRSINGVRTTRAILGDDSVA